MIPLHDDNPTTIRPVATIGLIAASVVVFLIELGLPQGAQVRLAYSLGVVPAVLFGDRALPPEIALVPPYATMITSTFLHGGLLHLGGNMLYLWIFGNNVEDAMGHGRFLVFYFLSGIAAALAQGALNPTSETPMIGASGAIGGVLGAYLLLHPRAAIIVAVPIFFFIQMMRVPAFVVLGLWFVLQFLNSAATVGSEGGVAYGAHVGGFVAGLVLVPLFRRRGVPLFDRRRLFRPRRGPWG